MYKVRRRGRLISKLLRFSKLVVFSALPYIYIYILKNKRTLGKILSINVNSVLFGINLLQKLFYFAKIFVLRLFEMAARVLLMKAFLVEKYEPCRRMCDAYGEVCFSKMFKNGLSRS